MTTVIDTPQPPCENMARNLREQEISELSHDAVEAMIDEYARHVESLLDDRAGHSRIEYAYSRLLGSRGNICRICPPGEMDKLDKRAIQRWSWAESHLRNYLGSADTLPKLITIAQRVEQGWADSMER